MNIVKYNGKNYILKEMRPSFNLGRDYVFLDGLKKYFDVRDLGMVRIKSNQGLERVDLKKRTFVGNWKFGEREVIYCMMKEFINIGDIGKHKDFLKNDSVFKECLKIRLFDGLFRSSDNILRNILINENGELMSIDEGDIYDIMLMLIHGGWKITIARLARGLDCSTRTIHRNMGEELKREKELLNQQLTD